MHPINCDSCYHCVGGYCMKFKVVCHEVRVELDCWDGNNKGDEKT